MNLQPYEILNIIHDQKTQTRYKLSTKNNLQPEHGVSHLGWQPLSQNIKKVCHGSTIKNLHQKPNTPQFLTWTCCWPSGPLSMDRSTTWICCWPSWLVAIARNYKNSCCASSVKNRNLQWKPNTPKIRSIFKLNMLSPVADLRGVRGTRTPPWGPNSFNSMQFLDNFGKIVCWRPPRGNHGSATGHTSWMAAIGIKILAVTALPLRIETCKKNNSFLNLHLE